MLVLGIHDGHNASATLVKDGVVLAALAEERLTNKKNQSGLPRLAIAKILEITQTDPARIDITALSSQMRVGDPLSPSNPALKILEIVPFSLPYVHVLKYFRQTGQLRDFLSSIGVGAPVRVVEHHMAHASSGYFRKPWLGKTLILTLDGAGDGLSATVSIGQGSEINRIASTSYFDSVSNNLYSETTGFLGLKRWEHEYKLMGMAPYGKWDTLLPHLQKLITLDREKLQFRNLSGKYARRIQQSLYKIFREQRFDNIAAATQKHFEDLVLDWVKESIKRTGIKRVVCSGGSFLNVKTNQLIRELPQVKQVYFDPICDDVGTSVGAALYASGKGVGTGNLYWGAEYSEEQIWETISKKGLAKKTARPRKLAQSIARLLAQGHIVARFSGRDEFGPRALGNRSILADPRSSEVIRKINFAIKMRDFWMPFAPAILEEDAPKYIKGFRPAPFMIESFHTTPAAAQVIAGLHPFDLTARPQTVNKTQNSEYYAIIKEFKRLTGVGGVLNTSFNLHGFPIVGTPEIAIDTFLNSGLDNLVLGPFLVSK